MSSDPVVNEIRRIREELAARFNYDVEAIGRYAQQLDASTTGRVVSRPSLAPIKFKKPPAKSA